MKKLQLIKPWRLRAMRLKLADARWEDDVLIYHAACNAPGTNTMEAIELSRYTESDIRTIACRQAAHNMVRTAAPGNNVCYIRTASDTVR